MKMGLGSSLPGPRKKTLLMPTSPSNYQNSGTAAAKAAFMHTAPCPVPIASYFLTQVETVTPPYCQTGPQWDPKQSGAEHFPIAGNSSAPAKPHYDLESRFGLIIRNKCRSTPVLGELDTALLLPENNKPALSLGSQSWEEIRERERRAETSSLDLLTSEPSAEAEQCAKPTHFFFK